MKARASGFMCGTVCALIMACVAQAAPNTNAAANGNPRVLPPQSRPYGKSYGEWSAAWWQWALSLSVSGHPLFDETGADAAEGQSGPVWFLGGTFTSFELGPEVFAGNAERTVTIPAGTALFFPILNLECSDTEGNGDTEADLRACTEFYIAGATNLSAELDGTPLQNLTNYRGPSPAFTFTLPDDNLFQSFGLDAPEGTTGMSVADGYYLMLAPLPVGQHELHFKGAFVYTTAEFGFHSEFYLDITYHITVR